MISPQESFARLRRGNRRFVDNLRRLENYHLTEDQRAELASGQTPHAIILGCSDSRAPAELIFDQGLGDLFVIRVAGNIVAPSQVGSVEFAAAQFHTRLVVVLGHSQCGAVKATIENLRPGGGSASPNIRFLVSHMRAAVSPLMFGGGPEDPAELYQQAIRANVRSSCERLRHGSAVLKRLIRDEGLVIVGAEYSIESGVVEYFNGVPASWQES